MKNYWESSERAEHRNRRIEDFQRRAGYAPQSVYQHRRRGWLYIPVHRFADETEEDVMTVDCWCVLISDAALLECVVRDLSPREPGLYARLDAAHPYWPKLQVVTDGAQLTRMVIEAAMEEYITLGFPDVLVSGLTPGGPAVRL